MRRPADDWPPRADQADGPSNPDFIEKALLRRQAMVGRLGSEPDWQIVLNQKTKASPGQFGKINTSLIKI
jgi:hypothetical protein